MGVAWQAVGCARGAYEHAVRYTKAREQFGRSIASFQLVQDLLVKMLSNVIDSDPKDVYVGMPVEVVFEDATEEITIPRFRPRG